MPAAETIDAVLRRAIAIDPQLAPRRRNVHPDRVVRFRASERTMHWAIAIPFLVCFATALILVLAYNPDPLRRGRAFVSWTHRLSGLCLFVLPLVSALRHRHERAAHFENFREAWRWRLSEVRWLFLMLPAMLSSRFSLPEEGKFNAAEKLNFMMVTCAYPLFAITGFLIWMPGIAFYSWLVHFGMAVLATPLLLGHIFMATVNPATRRGLSGMIDGTVEAHWAEHHYRRWYRETFGKTNNDALHEAATATAPGDGVPGTVRCPSCSEERRFSSFAEFVTALRSCGALVCAACHAPIDNLALTADPASVSRLVDALDRAAPAPAHENP